ncbi:DUF721 domain-containing protein [Galbibacter sp.]|uniref:DUF721 domain-containing protein n=1 Tax=Galbibacter sp. TaxID=2918471 RepID=UPI002CE381CA|nr:DUF721 domain-containing protein [Galbibacter sp.]HLV62018.1 DUF721 domain-containing protein [Galbibacter sp.]
MAKRHNESNSLNDLLKTFVQENSLEKGLNKIDVRNAWKNLMGQGVNTYTTEIELKRDTLYVCLSSSVLRQELVYGKDKIIKMINEELGKEIVKAIVFR